jgi:glutathione S-transferase
MPIDDETFILRSTLTSPFGRKVRMAADVLGLASRITIVPADYADERDSLRQQNPLGKIPCLVRPNGATVFDSSVIVEFLQHVAGTDRLVPLAGESRIESLVQTRLADGIIDAGALVIYEDRYHEPEQRSMRWLEHQRGKIQRALAEFEARLPDPHCTTAVTIGLACALAFLDKRRPIDWRGQHARLVDWMATFIATEPAFDRTRPPA